MLLREHVGRVRARYAWPLHDAAAQTYRPGSSHAGSRPPPAPHRRTRVLMAVHSAERGGAQLVALGQARALRREYDLVIAVGIGPLRAAFAEVAAAIVRGPTYLPIWGASTAGGRFRSAVPSRTRFGSRARLAASDRRGRRQQHGAGGARHRRPAGRRPGHRARAGGAEVRGREATVPRARRAGAHGRRDLAVDRTRLRRGRASVLLNPVGIPIPPRSGAAGPVRRRSGPARAGRHRGPPQAPGCRDRGRPGAARPGLEAELTLYGLEADPRLRRRASRTGARARRRGTVHFAGPTSDVAAPPAGRGRAVGPRRAR